MKVINVILSGGVGSRLWPLSRKSRPKQYLPIFNKQSLFQKTVFRNSEFCDQITIVGNKDNHLLSHADMLSLGINDYSEMIEAFPKNTAAAIAFAAFSTEPEDILFVTPSDQLIENNKEYLNSVDRAIQLAKEGYLVTFGISPSRVETGYGYIEFQNEHVISFREKPDFHTASNFVKSGNFLWNSGMFCFKSSVFLDELKMHTPKVFESSLSAFNKKVNNFLPEKETLEIPSISVDYAVMEKTKKIKVVKSEFGWSDMGSFESIYDYLKSEGHPVDENGNMAIGIDIHPEFVGLRDTIFVFTNDALLILNKADSQKIKQVYERLEKENPSLVS
ncbi:mannose-1-phosphate guanylyltransferase [Cognataquiflexum rubidum]|uniref:mannose-1-phosphate guanylyltransferase n=1 Tax=Cognataquiflexum rubidum TaxID=2922273 RepID=UPI001F142A77|nr:sugar phosphate nucleotidyltransferase [Cognataquiflexum rubidum]MCH6236773.1 mannose-1-phosphate guanylyltransferase [Cognataquiflexum rubidum]